VLEIGNRPPPLRDLVRDLWRHRRLMGMLARRDFFVRYRRASFGLLWAVIVPLSQALVLAAVLGRIARISTPGVPLTVFILSGMVAWTFFNSAVSGATTSIVDGAGMSTKIYFPRAVLPMVTVVAGMFGLALNLAVLLVLTPIYGSWPGWRLLLLHAAVALMAELAAAFGHVQSAIQVYFRDVRYLLDAVQRAWFYLTPVFYPITMIESLRPYIEANPATGMVELLRAATVGAEDGWITSLWWSFGWLAGLIVIGLYLHRRYDRLIADMM
jgi:lipopolysaccharide transport system permease protein